MALRMWRMCSYPLTWFSTLALLQRVPPVLSAPKHKVNMGPQGETQNFSVWSPWRWTPVLLSLCCGPCQHSLPCRAHWCAANFWLHMRDYRRSFHCCISTLHHISHMFVTQSSLAIEPWSCVWVHSFFLLFFSRV